MVYCSSTNNLYMALQTKPHANSPLLIALMLLNMGGVILLFVKDELDVQQLRSEIGIVRSAAEISNVTEVACSQGLREGAEAAATANGQDLSRVAATGLGYVVRTNGSCRGVYTLAEEERMPDPQSGEYLGVVSELRIGGSTAGQILSQTAAQHVRFNSPFAKTAFNDGKLVVSYTLKDLSSFDLPGCAVAITEAP
jgi:hypothetical protein